jgi:hypothetical protein
MTTINSIQLRPADQVPELVSAKAISVRFGLTKKGVLALPITQVRLGKRAIRYRLRDVIDFVERRTVGR